MLAMFRRCFLLLRFGRRWGLLCFGVAYFWGGVLFLVRMMIGDESRVETNSDDMKPN